MKKGKDYTGVAVVFVCYDGNGKFLFAKRGKNVRDGQGTWEIPAGGVEFGETIADALKRELKEELCIEPIDTEFIGYKNVIEKNGEETLKHWVTFEFLVRVDPAAVRIGEPDACESIEWRTFDDLPSPLHFGVDETILNVKEYMAEKVH